MTTAWVVMLSPGSPWRVTTVSLEYCMPPWASIGLLVSTRGGEIGVLGCRKRRGSHCVLSVTRAPVVVTLVVAGVPLAPVGRRRQGRRSREGESGLGRPRVGRERERERERGRGWAREWAAWAVWARREGVVDL
jgi:hypothetical protein